MNKKYKELTINDIHEIREENSKRFETMSNEDICNFIKAEADAFLGSVEQKDTVLA